MKIVNSTSIEMNDSVTALDLAAWVEGVPAGARIETICQTTVGDRPWESSTTQVLLQAKWTVDTESRRMEPLS